MTAELLEDVWSAHAVAATGPGPTCRGCRSATGTVTRSSTGACTCPPARRPWHQLVARTLGDWLRAAELDGLLTLDGVDVDFGTSVLEPDVLVVHDAAVMPDGDPVPAG